MHDPGTADLWALTPESKGTDKDEMSTELRSKHAAHMAASLSLPSTSPSDRIGEKVTSLVNREVCRDETTLSGVVDYMKGLPFWRSVSSFTKVEVLRHVCAKLAYTIELLDDGEEGAPECSRPGHVAIVGKCRGVVDVCEKEIERLTADLCKAVPKVECAELDELD